MGVFDLIFGDGSKPDTSIKKTILSKEEAKALHKGSIMSKEETKSMHDYEKKTFGEILKRDINGDPVREKKKP